MNTIRCLFVNAENTNIQVEVATSLAARLRGLLGRNELTSDSALLISPCNSVHTFGMRFPIDVAYLDQHLRVIKTVTNLKANRASMCWPAKQVMEFAVGSLERLDIKPGKQLRLVGAE